MTIKIVASAKRDLVEGRSFYESQDTGLGNYFLLSVSTDIEGLRVTAGVHAVAYKDYHRALCRVFPFAVYYTMSSGVVTVYAVVDCRRDPAWIRRHLDETGGQPNSTDGKAAADS